LLEPQQMATTKRILVLNMAVRETFTGITVLNLSMLLHAYRQIAGGQPRR